MAHTYEITLGPKNREHTTIEFDADQMIHTASVYSEQLDQWIYLNEEQLEKLALQASVQRAMTEYFYQAREARNEAV